MLVSFSSLWQKPWAKQLRRIIWTPGGEYSIIRLPCCWVYTEAIPCGQWHSEQEENYSPCCTEEEQWSREQNRPFQAHSQDLLPLTQSHISQFAPPFTNPLSHEPISRLIVYRVETLMTWSPVTIAALGIKFQEDILNQNSINQYYL